jgi:hypothetical protein
MTNCTTAKCTSLFARYRVPYCLSVPYFRRSRATGVLRAPSMAASPVMGMDHRGAADAHIPRRRGD